MRRLPAAAGSSGAAGPAAAARGWGSRAPAQLGPSRGVLCASLLTQHPRVRPSVELRVLPRLQTEAERQRAHVHPPRRGPSAAHCLMSTPVSSMIAFEAHVGSSCASQHLPTDSSRWVWKDHNPPRQCKTLVLW